jgi:hypothetical protein
VQGYVETEQSGTIRDLNSKALLTTDQQKYYEYKKKLSKDKEIERMGFQLNNLEQEMLDMKQILSQILTEMRG